MDTPTLQASRSVQNRILDYVSQSLTHERMPHTILLNGKNGYGLFATAWDIAQLIFCPNRVKHQACGICTHCKKINQLQHPDLHLYFPISQPKKNSEDFIADFRKMMLENPYNDFTDWQHMLGNKDKHLNIYKSVVEEINHGFHFKAHYGGSRVYLIWGAEFLGKEGNRLLKIIEEPPEQCYIILMVENRKAVLPTIQSRAQNLLLEPLTTHQLAKLLDLASTPKAHQSLEVYGGNYQKAKQGFGEVDDDLTVEWINLLRIAYKGHPVETVVYAKSLAQKGRSPNIQFLTFGAELIRVMLHSHLGIPVKQDSAIIKLAQLLDVQDLHVIQERAQADILHIQRNANLNTLTLSFVLFLTACFRRHKRSAAKS